MKTWGQDHKKERSTYMRIYRQNHKKEISDQRRAYRLANKEKTTSYMKIWHQDHEKEELIYRRNRKKETAKYMMMRRRNNINSRLADNLRSRMWQAVHGNFKTGSAVRDLGCSISSFRLYIENQFEPKMSWDNYGKWHLDHVQPLVSFDLTDKPQFLTACNWLNYQPLWAGDNIRKRSHV